MSTSSSGSIYIEIDGRTDKLRDALKQAKTEAKGIAADIAKQTENAFSSGAASVIMNRVNQSFGSLRAAIRTSKADISGLNEKFTGMTGKLGLVGTQVGQFSSAMERAFRQRAASDIQQKLRDIQRQTGMIIWGQVPKVVRK